MIKAFYQPGWICCRILLLLQLTLPAAAQRVQSMNRDSLQHALAKSPRDTSKVFLLVNIGLTYTASSPDTAIIYFDQSIALADSLHFLPGKVKASICKSGALNIMAKMDESLSIMKKAIIWARQTNRHHLIASSTSNTGNCFFFKSMYDSALFYWTKGMQLFEEESDSVDAHILYGNIAGTYVQLKRRYDTAYMYGLKTMLFFRKPVNKNLYQETAAMLNAGIALIKLKKFDSGLLVLQQGYALSKANRFRYQQARIGNNLCGQYLRQGQLDSVKKYGYELLAIAKENNDMEGQCLASAMLANYYLFMKDIGTAEKLNDSAAVIASQHKLPQRLMNAAKTSANIALLRNDISNFFYYEDRLDSIEIAMQDEVMVENAEKFRVQYETAKKEQQLQLQAATIKEERLYKTFLGAALVLVLLIGLFIYRAVRNKQRLLLAEQQIQRQQIARLETEKELLATRSVIQGQEEERKRLAKDLHDGLGGFLSSTKFSLNTMKENMVVTADNLDVFEKTMSMLDQSITELRRVAHNMMPETLMKLSLNEALQDYCLQVSESGVLKVNYQNFDTSEKILPDAVKITVYRVVQELINNSIKHAKAKNAVVQFTHDEEKLMLTVEDDGKGFDTGILQLTPGIGYKNLESRVNFLKGQLDIQSQPGKGVSVYIEIPLIV